MSCATQGGLTRCESPETSSTGCEVHEEPWFQDLDRLSLNLELNFQLQLPTPTSNCANVAPTPSNSHQLRALAPTPSDSRQLRPPRANSDQLRPTRADSVLKISVERKCPVPPREDWLGVSHQKHRVPAAKCKKSLGFQTWTGCRSTWIQLPTPTSNSDFQLRQSRANSVQLAPTPCTRANSVRLVPAPSPSRQLRPTPSNSRQLRPEESVKEGVLCHPGKTD